MFKNKTLLITGGTGSFGNAVLNRFLNTDHREPAYRPAGRREPTKQTVPAVAVSQQRTSDCFLVATKHCLPKFGTT